jgi:hypothetical protein
MFGAQKPRISVPITYQSQTTREESRGTTLALWAIFFIVKYTKHHTLLYFRALTPIQHINIPLQIRFKTHTRRFWCHTSSITATFFLYKITTYLFLIKFSLRRETAHFQVLMCTRNTLSQKDEILISFHGNRVDEPKARSRWCSRFWAR